jgi:signal transduction histidine kinase
MMLAAVGRLIVPTIADWCSIDLVNEDGLIDCAAVIHDDPKKVETILELRRQHQIDPAGRHAIPMVIRTGRTEAAFRVTDSLVEELSQDETIRRVLTSLGLQSAVCVPIVARGLTLGAITIATAESGRELGEATVELGEELGRRVGLALDNAHLLRELEKSLESKDEFLGLMSHELRTPITAIYGGTRLLRTRGEGLDSDNREQVLSDIENESERMFRMVENLLALSRTELGERPPSEPVLVHRIIKKVVTAHRERHPHRNIETDMADDVRPVEGQTTYVEQVVRNLLSNAEKYTPNDAPIMISVEEEDDGVLVSVKDTGPGLEESEAQMIFDRFYRGSGESRRLRGLGLGLTVCKRLVEAMGGTIWAERQKPNGLKISFALPLCGEESE